MYTLRRCIPIFLAITMATASALAQSGEGTKFYKLEFVVKEVDGTKVLNSRAYSTITLAGDKSTIRTDSKVTRKLEGGTQYQQYNIGIGIDAKVLQEFENRLSLNIAVDLTTMAEEESMPSAPILRQNRWNSTLVVLFKKPTVVFTSDNPTSKRQMQMEVTATPIL